MGCCLYPLYDKLMQSALKPPVTNVLPSKFYSQQKVTIQTSSTVCLLGEVRLGNKFK